MGTRVIRTRAQRIADNEAQVAKDKKAAGDSAIRLRAQAQAWVTRSGELLVKAEGAKAKADNELKEIGIDPEVFWKEHDLSQSAQSHDVQSSTSTRGE